TSYIAQVTVGTQTVPLLVDTGSSDLWVAPSSFQCLDESGKATNQSACDFPAFYEGSFSGGVVPDEYFSIIYGNGQYLYGPYGLESVSFGGVTVHNQQIALPSEGYFHASTGDFAGLLGLAYPAMVPARKGQAPKPALNNSDEFGEHDTWFFNAVRQNLTEPIFSMALDVDGDGLLGIGEIVDVPLVGNFTSTPILVVNANDVQTNLVNETRAATNFTYYTIIADDYIIDGKPFSKLSEENNDIPASQGFPVVVDSGWSANVLPPSLVTHFYDTFADPPKLVDIGGGNTMFTAPCDATVPEFGVQIGTEVFTMARETILVSRLNTTLNGTMVCGLGIQPGVEFAGVLGDTFLSNVVAVFDVGASEMRFGQRV
ncbi:acid protease, partial [Cryphonectria parasitica EP155]